MMFNWTCFFGVLRDFYVGHFNSALFSLVLLCKHASFFSLLNQFIWFTQDGRWTRFNMFNVETHVLVFCHAAAHTLLERHAWIDCRYLLLFARRGQIVLEVVTSLCSWGHLLFLFFFYGSWLLLVWHIQCWVNNLIWFIWAGDDTLWH